MEVIVVVCAAFGLTVSEAKTEIMYYLIVVFIEFSHKLMSKIQPVVTR